MFKIKKFELSKLLAYLLGLLLLVLGLFLVFKSNFSFQAETACIISEPSLSIGPAENNSLVAPTPNFIPESPAGSTLNYVLTIKNNDSSGCAYQDFNISGSAPTGWVIQPDMPALYIGPSEHFSAMVSVTSPSIASVGDYAFTITATGKNSWLQTSITSFYGVRLTGWSIFLETDKPTYYNGGRKGADVTIKATLLKDGKPAPNNRIDADIAYATRMDTKGNPIRMRNYITNQVTNAKGQISYKIHLVNADPKGEYVISMVANNYGKQIIGSRKTFLVQ